MNFTRFKENLSISAKIITNLRIKPSDRELKLFFLKLDYEIGPWDLTSSEIIKMLKGILFEEIEYEHFFTQNFKLFNVKNSSNAETSYKLDIIAPGEHTSPFSKQHNLSYKFMALLKQESPDYLLDKDINPFRVTENLGHIHHQDVLFNFYENLYISFYFITLFWFIVSIHEQKEPNILLSSNCTENAYKTDMTMLIDTIDVDYSTILDNYKEFQECIDDYEFSFQKYTKYFHSYCEFIYNSEETIIKLSKIIRRVDLDTFFSLLIYCNFTDSMPLITCKDNLSQFLKKVLQRCLDSLDNNEKQVSLHPFYLLDEMRLSFINKDTTLQLFNTYENALYEILQTHYTNLNKKKFDLKQGNAQQMLNVLNSYWKLILNLYFGNDNIHKATKLAEYQAKDAAEITRKLVECDKKNKVKSIQNSNQCNSNKNSLLCDQFVAPSQRPNNSNINSSVLKNDGQLIMLGNNEIGQSPNCGYKIMTDPMESYIPNNTVDFSFGFGEITKILKR